MELPKYVKLNDITLRLVGNKYWRDAGRWGINFKIKNNKIFSSHWRKGADHLHNIELFPITEEEWKIHNEYYFNLNNKK